MLESFKRNISGSEKFRFRRPNKYLLVQTNTAEKPLKYLFSAPKILDGDKTTFYPDRSTF